MRLVCSKNDYLKALNEYYIVKAIEMGLKHGT